MTRHQRRKQSSNELRKRWWEANKVFMWFYSFGQNLYSTKINENRIGWVMIYCYSQISLCCIKEAVMITGFLWTCHKQRHISKASDVKHQTVSERTYKMSHHKMDQNSAFPSFYFVSFWQALIPQCANPNSFLMWGHCQSVKRITQSHQPEPGRVWGSWSINQHGFACFLPWSCTSDDSELLKE